MKQQVAVVLAVLLLVQQFFSAGPFALASGVALEPSALVAVAVTSDPQVASDPSVKANAGIAVALYTDSGCTTPVSSVDPIVVQQGVCTIWTGVSNGYIVATENEAAQTTTLQICSSGCSSCSVTMTRTYGLCAVMVGLTPTVYGKVNPLLQSSFTASVYQDPYCSVALPGGNSGTYSGNVCDLMPPGVVDLTPGSYMYTSGGLLKEASGSTMYAIVELMCSTTSCVNCQFVFVEPIGVCFLGNPGNSPAMYVTVNEVSGGLSVGAIVGIVVAVIAVVGCVCLSTYYFVVFKKPAYTQLPG